MILSLQHITINNIIDTININSMDVINMDKINELRLGLETAYIDGSVASDSFYCPQFVSNNYKSGKKVLSSIEDELLRCDKFQISVAFITMSGITPLLQTFKDLEKKNIPGEILTTNYLNFSEPKALEKLNGNSCIYSAEKCKKKRNGKE